jgi:hypothetical protein
MALKANCYALYELFYTYAPEIVPLCHNLVIVHTAGMIRKRHTTKATQFLILLEKRV